MSTKQVLVPALVALAIALGSGSAAAWGATYPARDGAALEAALQKSQDHPGADTIELVGSDYLPRSPLTVRGDVTIAGPASGRAAKIAGTSVDPYPSVLLTVVHGATLRLQRVIVTGGGGNGLPAIDDYGATELDGVTVAGNGGAGLHVEPGGGTAVVRNSTFSDGLDFGIIDQGEARVVNATVAGNANGGIDAVSGVLHLVNTIVAGNGFADCTAPIPGADHSIDGDGTCGVGALSHVDPLLGRLVDNGGPTSTRAFTGRSPAIDAGDEHACPATDQRGARRSDGRCDIGAYEAGASAPPGATDPSARANGGRGGPSLRPFRSIRAQGRFRRGHGWVTFRVIASTASRRITLVYRDAAAHVVFRALTLRSLGIDSAHRAATLTGTGRASGRRVTFVAVVKADPRRGSISLRLSNRYRRQGQVARGSVRFLY